MAPEVVICENSKDEPYDFRVCAIARRGGVTAHRPMCGRSALR